MGQQPTEADLRARLAPEQYRATVEAGTERAFTGEHRHDKRAGRYPGQLFVDGSQPSGQRFCINSAAPDFKQESDS